MADLANTLRSENPSADNSLYLRCIQAQAHVAYSKVNRTSGMEVDDFVSLGLQVLADAKLKWKPEGGSKFTTYLTQLLQNRFYKEVAKSHRKKRGGAGNKAEDKRFGRSERWENGEAEAAAVQHVSINESNDNEHDSSKGYGELQIAAPADNTAEYELLLEQVERLMPQPLRPIFKQMVDPDPELLQLAVARSEGEKRCTIDTKLMAEYLGIDPAKLRTLKRSVQLIVAKEMGVEL